MTLDIRIDASELARFRERFGAEFEVRASAELRAAMIESLSFAQGFLANYPPRPVSFHARFVSDKQRRFFFWALREGKIQVPYRRTTTLGPGWGQTMTDF